MGPDQALLENKCEMSRRESGTISSYKNCAGKKKRKRVATSGGGTQSGGCKHICSLTELSHREGSMLEVTERKRIINKISQDQMGRRWWW